MLPGSAGPILAIAALVQLPLDVLPKLGHSPNWFAAFWGVAYLTLLLAVGAANLFSILIGSDFELHSLRNELLLAAVGSVIEAAGAWLIAAYVPAGARGLFLPLLIVGLLYQVAHYDTWNRFDAILVMLLQLAMLIALVSFALGHFVFGVTVLAILVLFLTILAALAKGL